MPMENTPWYDPPTRSGAGARIQRSLLNPLFYLYAVDRAQLMPSLARSMLYKSQATTLAGCQTAAPETRQQYQRARVDLSG